MVKLSTAILLATVSICSAGQLLIEDLNDGANCRRPSRDGDKLNMHYTGTLASNGQQFDSSIGRGPFEFELGAGNVIKGWDQGLSGMCPGDKRKLTIPPELGYGSRGAGAVIPGGATLVFEVQLVGIEPGEDDSSDVYPQIPEPESPHTDNDDDDHDDHNDHDDHDDEEDKNSNSAGKSLVQMSFVLFCIVISVYI